MSEGMEGSAPAEATAAEGVSQVTSAPSEGAQSVADAVSANNGEMTASDAAAVQEMIDLGQMGDRLVEVTVDGETLRMPLSEVVANTQRAKASHKRFLEAAEARKVAEQKERDIEALVRELKGSNPEEILRELGVDTQGIARREHKRLMDWESMTPEERFRAEMQRERDQLELEKGQWEKQKQTAAEKKRTAQLEAQSRHYQEKYTRDFTAALSNVGVSAESKAYPQMLQFMAQVASEALDAGIAIEVRPFFTPAATAGAGQATGVVLVEVRPVTVEGVFLGNLARGVGSGDLARILCLDDIQRLVVLVELQHGVGLEGLLNLLTQVERRQLQQLDRLLELRRHEFRVLPIR